MQKIDEIENLVKIISKLPGLGPKSAKRIVLKLINNREELIKPMANTMAKVYKNVIRCNSCGSLKSNTVGCLNCESVKEKFDKICVVEDIADQWSIENSNIYRGYFHILGGTIASVGHRKEDLLINSLIERVNKGKIEKKIENFFAAKMVYFAPHGKVGILFRTWIVTQKGVFDDSNDNVGKPVTRAYTAKGRKNNIE